MWVRAFMEMPSLHTPNFPLTLHPKVYNWVIVFRPSFMRAGKSQGSST